MKVCVVIPNYNHCKIKSLLFKLEPYKLPVIIVDDGSNVATKQELTDADKLFFWVHLITLPYNQGKGAAVLAGFEYAAQQNYTHAIQIDADGQHEVGDLPKFLAAIEAYPQALIVGQPIYDSSIPKSRLYGREITNFWVRVETFSTDIKDAMCGYRAYPLQQTLQIMHKHSFAKRMGFDIEIIVRWYWSGAKIISLPTKVIYPNDGVSHFRFLRDNLLISWLHTCLFFGMLKYFISGGKKNQLPDKRPNQHWSKIKEKGSFLGMIIILRSYRVLGKRVTHWLLYPIVAYFYCFSAVTRKASQEYLARVGCKTSSFKHFLSFADSILDKLSAWNDGNVPQQVDLSGIDLLHAQITNQKGGVIFTAHLGNIEIARVLSKLDSSVKINAIMFTENAKKITSFFEKINPQFGFNIIYLEKMDMHLFVTLHEKVMAGEYLVITCDRTSTTNPQRSVKAKFLGDDAYFPEGPFILAGLLQCPVYFMLCLKQDKKPFKIIFQQFAAKIELKKAERKQQLQIYVQKYAQLLEEYCRKYPLQWFNFFDFWKRHENEQ